jgi:hypothetical protein
LVVEYSSLTLILSLELKRNNESKPKKVLFKLMLSMNILLEYLPDIVLSRLGFYVSGLMYLTEKLQRVNVNIYANARNVYITTEHFPPPVVLVVWVNFTYTLLSCELVDSASSSSLSRSAWREKHQAFPAEGLNCFHEALK